MASLDDLRRQIDLLDDQIVQSLNARAELARRIGAAKQTAGVGVFSPDREREILERVTARSVGPLPRHSLLAVYRELMSASFALERPPRIGYLGPAGSHTHEAALGKFGSSVEYEPLLDLRGVFEEIARGRVDYGVVPVENTTGGAVLDCLDGFVDHDVKICCEVRRAIHHHLLGRGPMEEIETVYSRPEALAQCRGWLAETGLAQKLSPVSSTSRAAELAATQPRAAAVGGTLAGRLYGLRVLAAHIEDDPRNATRFFVLGRETAGPTGEDRTSLMFATAHRAGALVEVLLVFQRHAVNMTMITSRPCPGEAMEYNFFVDVDGHAERDPLRGAIEEARHHCRTLRVLGSYPRVSEVLDEEPSRPKG